MRTSRLEAFSDGVMAIIITIMVLELHVPEGSELADLEPVVPQFGAYLLSFIYVGIYWSNHHHMFQLARRVTGAVLWANLALLFFLSIFPFSTAWMEESEFARTPMVFYGANLLAAALAYTVLVFALIHAEGESSYLQQAIGPDRKGKLSPVLYVTGILLSFVNPYLGLACYTVVALMWLVPDRRLERFLNEHAVAD
jgi:uncharacterized membrane protein